MAYLISIIIFNKRSLHYSEKAKKQSFFYIKVLKFNIYVDLELKCYSPSCSHFATLSFPFSLLANMISCYKGSLLVTTAHAKHSQY